MPTRKLVDPHPPMYADSLSSRCYDPDHEPARLVVREPGLYSHECPTCDYRVVFRVDRMDRMG